MMMMMMMMMMMTSLKFFNYCPGNSFICHPICGPQRLRRDRGQSNRTTRPIDLVDARAKPAASGERRLEPHASRPHASLRPQARATARPTAPCAQYASHGRSWAQTPVPTAIMGPRPCRIPRRNALHLAHAHQVVHV